MIKTSDAYKQAITAPRRRIFVKAVVDIVDPDLTYGTVISSSEAPWSKPEQLHNKEMVLGPRYATLETGRWVLDGAVGLIPADPKQLAGEVGAVGDTLCDARGVFYPAVFVEQRISNIKLLQACTVYFSLDPLDGVPVDFAISVRSGGVDQYQKNFNGNRETFVSLDGFTVHSPDTIRITVTKWSLPNRRVRVTEIIPGIYEEWQGDKIAGIDVRMLGNFSCMAIPYSTCTFTLNNKDRRFEPYSKSSMFRSIEDRQKIELNMSVDGIEWVPIGVYYQASGGWQTGSNDMTLTWNLSDIVGLLAQREFILKGQLPTTLGGWMAALVSQLGANFANRWHVDPAYKDRPITVSNAKDLEGLTCGTIARFAAMATGTWIRADQETGDLTAEPLWNQGNQLKPTAMPTYPTKRANGELAALIFKLNDGKDTTYTISGNSTSSSETLSINNPFIHTQAQAIAAARQILSQCGGIRMETVSRGDPSSEIGDVDTVWISDSEAKTGRRMEQSLAIKDGVLKDCKSVLLQADGSFLYENRQVFMEDSIFHTGPTTTKVRLIAQGGGQGGARGQDGTYANDFSGEPGWGKDGLNGHGGKVFNEVVDVSPNTDYKIIIGKGGKSSDEWDVPGEEGTATKFGVYSSENGKVFPFGFTDIVSGSSYGRTGVIAPKNGTGDGGKGGNGGYEGNKHMEPTYDSAGNITGSHTVVDTSPGKGTDGVDGADGICVVYWEK